MSRLRPLARFADAAEAEIAAGFLRSQGIDARLPDRAFLSVHPELGMSRGGHRIEVPEAQHWEAARLLAERNGSAPEPCEDCGAEPTARPSSLSRLIGRLFPSQTPPRCAACGAQREDAS